MNEVDVLRFEWNDSRRNRKIPVKVYFPKGEARVPCPVIIFSHGLGGSRENYGYLGECWAGHGYVSVHLQHPGSDIAVWQNVPAGEVTEALRKAARQPENTSNRIQDVLFALDQLAQLTQEPGVLQNRLDLQRIGLAGHSFGALTTLAIAGEVFTTPSGHQMTSPDLRVKAAMAMSSPLPRDKAHWQSAFSRMRIPCLHMTGTEDNIIIGNSPPADRRVPFDRTVGADAWLITFQGGDHMVFVGLKRNAARVELDDKIQRLIQKSSVMYWDGMLRGDREALAQFNDRQMAEWLGKDAKFEGKTQRNGEQI